MEAGSVSKSHLPDWGFLEVIRASDDPSRSNCQISRTKIKSGTQSIDHGEGLLTFACNEYDSNGGDCAIRAEILCVPK